MVRPRLGKHQAVGIEDEPAYVCVLQNGIESLAVAAFRQPKTARLAAEHFPIAVAADADLSALRFGEILQQWEEGVGRSAGDDFETARVLQLAKCPERHRARGFGRKNSRVPVKRSA